MNTNAKNTGKDTIYIDADDEITTIIDKVRSSSGKIVALVLPKRASVFQSIVNMKLLKRSADDAKKHLVLITTEAGLLPLAGTVGLYVAATPQSKPEIPAAPGEQSDDEVIDEPDDDDQPAYTAENAGNRPVGDLARGAGAGAAAGGIETLALDDEEDTAAESAEPETVGKPVVAPTKKDKKLKVPNFNRFRMLIVLGVLALLILGVLAYVAAVVLPKARITIKTDASEVNSSLEFTLDTSADTLDKENMIVPAKAESEQKTQSQEVPATGQKNNGDNATGSVTMTAKKCGGNPFEYPGQVPAGTGISSSGKTYITQASTSFQGGGIDADGCFTYNADGDTPIKAQSPGTKYNVASASFTVAGRPDVSATGSADGGTDDIVKVVQQSDIDSAQKKMESVEADTVKQDLSDQLRQDGLYPLVATYKAGNPKISSSSPVGDETDTVTVTATYTYTMFGTQKQNLDTLLNDDIKNQVDTSKETILTNGLDDAVVKVLDSTDTTRKVNLQATGTVGPELHLDDIKKQAAGRKSGDVQPEIKNLPGVTDVQINLSPFWVGSIPKNTDKITIVVEKPTPAK
ncbi:MAG TPA: hypothetical protein VFL85_04755 [Candidatus Saccharimonadales bacterium]|nr:hypothetical protein [Candidatus Saccharimonadales bacterium]